VGRAAALEVPAHERERRAEWRIDGPRACKRVDSYSVVFTSSGGWFGCSNTTTLDPARRRPLRCGDDCPLVPVSAVVFA
jgi:hypothetical protein